MDAAEVIVREPERESRFMVRPLFRVSVGQSRHASNRHADRLIRLLGMAGANLILVRVAGYDNRVGVNHLTRRAPSFVGWSISIILDRLGEINRVAERIRHGGSTGGEWNRLA